MSLREASGNGRNRRWLLVPVVIHILVPSRLVPKRGRQGSVIELAKVIFWVGEVQHCAPNFVDTRERDAMPISAPKL